MWQFRSRRLALLLTLACCAPRSARADDSPPASDASAAELREYYSGNGLLQRGLYELAAVEYRKFLTAHAEHEKAPIAHYGLAVCLFRTQQYDAALVELNPLAARQEFAYAAEVAVMLGQAQLAQQHYDPAIEAFERVLRDFSKHELAADAAAELAEALCLKGDGERAIQQCQQFAARWPESPLRARTEFFHALALMNQRQFGGAAERFAAVLKQYPKGQLTERIPLLLAQCQHNSGALDQAAAQYRRVIDQADARSLPEALLGLGSLLLTQHRPVDAGAVLDQFLEKFSNSAAAPAARVQRGRAWFDQGQFDRALACFEAVGGADADIADDAAYWIAKCKLRQEQFADAADRLAQAINQFSRSELLPEMLYDRAVALTRAGRHEAAVKSLETFRERFPQHALGAAALQLLAVTEQRQQRYSASAVRCREFLAAYPRHELTSAVFFLLAENLFLQGELEQAAESYRQFLEQFPGDSQVPAVTFRLGLALNRLQRYDEALPLLTESAATAGKDPVFRAALLALGDVYFQRSEWKSAERYLSEYLATDPSAPAADDALLKLGLAQERQNRHDQALKSFDELLQRFSESPQHLQALFERGQVLVALQQFDQAAEAFERVLSEAPDSRFAPYALNHLGAIALQRKQFDQAAQRFERAAASAADGELSGEAAFQRAAALMAAQDYARAEEVFTAFLDQNPNHPRAPQARAQRAIALSRLNRPADALKAIKQVEEAGGNLDDSLRSALRYEQAWCLRELGRGGEAAESYRQLLDDKGSSELNAHALLELAGIEFGAKRYDEAAKLLRRLRSAIQSDASGVPRELQEPAAYRLATCEYELHHFAESLELFEEFIAKFGSSPLIPSASFLCGDACMQTGKHERAIGHLQRVVEQYPSDAACGPSLLRLGECLAERQRWAASEKTYAEFLDRFPENEQWFAARFGLGWARENQNHYDEALEAYQQVVARHKGPTAARAQFQIGECLFAKEKYEQAAAELLKVDILYAYPEWSAAALYEAGRCFEKMSKSAEARAQFKTVVEKFKDTRWAEMAAKQLAQ
ncbi:MAG TPA: tetratricopeptide repeat protein [Phycisphaerae bacterium]